MGNTLHLILKKKWFDMILSGEKKEEYRDIKDYWVNRLTWRHDEIDGIAWQELIESLKDKKKFGYDSYKEILDTYLCEMAYFTKVSFRNGYAKNAPEIVVKCKGVEIGKSKPEWSDNWQGDVFIIKLGEILETKNITL